MASSGTAIITTSYVRGVGSSSRETTDLVNRNLAVLASYPAADITGINFSLMTYEDIKNSSVVEVVEAAKNPGGAGKGTPHDTRLGVYKGSASCDTCGMDPGSCNGHTGDVDFHCHIAPPEKELQYQLRLLFGSMCAGGRHPILSDNLLRLQRAAADKVRSRMQPVDWHTSLLEAIYKVSLPMSCRYATEGSGHSKFIYSLDVKTDGFSNAGFATGTLGRNKADVESKIELEYYYSVLESLTPFQLYCFGYADPITLPTGETVYTTRMHPRALILRAIVVTPLCSRSPMVSNNTPVFHPHTKLYNLLAEAAKDVKIARQKMDRLVVSHREIHNDDSLPVSEAYDSAVRTFYSAVTTLYNIHNDMYESEFKGIISNKYRGLGRNEAQGKTVMNIDRSPVVPDPRNGPGEISFPRKAAAKTGIRVAVTIENLAHLTSLLKEGKVKFIHPHTATIANTRVQVNTHNMAHLSLQIGDEVTRELMVGDSLIFIRQPALGGLSSIAGKIVRLWDELAFGFALHETVIRAMDFDGDEAQGQSPQTEEARSELESILSVDQLLIEPKDQKIVFGVVQDGILGANIATVNPLLPSDSDREEDVKNKGYIHRSLFDRITALVSPECATEISKEGEELGIRDKLQDFERRLNKHGKVLTKQLITSTGSVIEVVPTDVLVSWTFPPDVQYSRGNTIIKDGILTAGVVGKSVIGGTHDTLTHNVNEFISARRAILLLKDVAVVCTSFLSFYGISAGWSDCAPVKDSIQKGIGEILIKLYSKIDAIPQPIDSIDARRYQSELEGVILTASTEADVLIHSGLSADNKVLRIISSGTKGTERHLYSIVGMLGQQYAAGKLPAKLMTGGTRHTSYFSVDDRDPAASGMCVSSLSEGITPAEAIPSSAAARMSFINLHVSTPGIGKTSNEMYRVCQSVVTNEQAGCVDGTTLISSLYGGDGFSGKHLRRIRQPNGQLCLRFADLEALTDQENAKRGWYRS